MTITIHEGVEELVLAQWRPSRYGFAYTSLPLLPPHGPRWMPGGCLASRNSQDGLCLVVRPLGSRASSESMNVPASTCRLLSPSGEHSPSGAPEEQRRGGGREQEPCPTCEGWGTVVVDMVSVDRMPPEFPCPDCGGAG